MSEETWTVLRTTLETMDIQRASAIMANWTELLPTDAATRLRTCRGVIVRGLSQEAATGIARDLTSAGIPCLSVPDLFAMPPPQPYFLRSAGATQLAFSPTRDLPGQPMQLPWAELHVIVAGRVIETEMKPVASFQNRFDLISAPVRRIGMVTSPNTVPEKNTHDRLQILGGNPLQHYRLESRRFNYGSILPDPAPVAEANFCRLVRGILQLAPQAATNISPQHLQADGGIAMEVFNEAFEFERLVTWLYALIRTGSWHPEIINRGDTNDRTVQVHS